MPAPRRLVPVASLALAIVAAAPGAARAIGQCVCLDRPWAAPAFTRNAPLDPRVFVSLRGLDPATLRLAEGETPVPIRTEPAGGRPHQLWVTPLRPLAPGKTYELWVRLPNGGGEEVLATLETPPTAGADRAPPRLGPVGSAGGGLADNCGPIEAAAELTDVTYEDDLSHGSGIVLQLDVELAGGRRERLFLPHSGARSPWRGGVGTGPISATGADCLGDQRLPGAVAGRPYAATLTAWDWAGHASAPVALSLTLTPAPPPATPVAPPVAPIPTTRVDGGAAAVPGPAAATGGPADAGADSAADAGADAAASPPAPSPAAEGGAGCAAGGAGATGGGAGLVVAALGLGAARRRRSGGARAR